MSTASTSRAVAALATVLSVVLALAGPAAIAGPDIGPPGEPSDVADPAAMRTPVTPARIDGDDRVDTAAIAAEVTFDASTTTAVVARDDDFPDALAGAAAAGAEDGPVLLVRSDAVPERTSEVLTSLAIERIVIIGGDEAVSHAVQEQLSLKYETTRLGGEDRYATAAAVGRHVAASVGVGNMFGDRAALLVSGEDFPDALASGPLAYSGHLPILLTRADELAAATTQALTELGIARVLIVGGPAAVSTTVETRVTDLGIAVERVGGDNRRDTAARFADRLVDTWQYSAERPMLARGDDFPDALAAAPRGGAVEAPVLLTRTPDALSPATRGWLAERCRGVEAVQAVGGRTAVSADTLADAVAAAETCDADAGPDPQRTISYEIGTQGTVHADLGVFRRRAEQALNDERGWSLGGDLAFTEVDDGGDFRLWLASPQAVADAAPGCSAQWSCRVGDDVYINDERFREGTATYEDRSLTAYQWYVINHEVGHWLGVGHADCSGAGQPAPVMQQQSIDLAGCSANVWPLPWERDIVRDRWLP